MDNFTKHLAPLPRRFPSGLPLDSIGYMFRKTSWVKRRFQSFNFSIILSGGGRYRFNGEDHRVIAPCVITQWPNQLMEYGPEPPYLNWEELYLIYPVNVFPELQRRGLAKEDKPIWHIQRPSQTLELARKLLDMLQSPESDGMPDRMDRLAETLILETRLAELSPPGNRDEEIIGKIRRYVRENLQAHHDFDRLARRHGLSPSSFRRHWNRYVHSPPARYVNHLRIREARQILAETDNPIAEIAGDLGFGDPLYFSRKFRQFVGVTASQYRKDHHRDVLP